MTPHVLSIFIPLVGCEALFLLAAVAVIVTRSNQRVKP